MARGIRTHIERRCRSHCSSTRCSKAERGRTNLHRKLVTKIQEDFGLGRGEAEAIVLALSEKARVLGIDEKNGINACKLLGVAFTTGIGILVRMCEKRMLTTSEALAKLEGLAKYGRYKKSILEDATRQLEAA
jgi:predicted nucleic acid-binding protein